ncbi:MAG: glycosyltransferase [Clostridia bacterium]|nr:glycosyltransferase [Clostridia bacterium]
MKVCLLNDSFPPVIDGVVNVMTNYAHYLMNDYGAEVIVGTPRYPEADYNGYPYPVIPYQSFDTTAITNGYRTGNPFAEKEVNALAAFKPDILHAHCPASATIIARILRDEVDAPLVFTYHTKYDIDIRRAVRNKSLAEESIKAMVGNIEACDDVWVVSRGAGESLKELGFSGNYLVMDNGVDFERGRVDADKVADAVKGYDLPEGIPMFLFVGRLINYKNLPLILDAMRKLDEAGMDFRMVFIGKGPDDEMLRSRAKELGLMDDAGHGKVIFVGPIYDRDVLRAWNTRADLFIFPSTFDTNGLVVREAAACGLASVLIRDSCAAEGITDGRSGFIIEENADSLAELLIQIGSDLPKMHEAGQHAMDEIYLSWKDCVGRAYDRYNTVLEMKKSGLLVKKKQATDYLVSATAAGMAQREKLRQIGNAFLSDMKETRSGMMEYIHEAEENVSKRLDSLKEGPREKLEALKNAVKLESPWKG